MKLKSLDSYPKQGPYLRKQVEVCFNYNTADTTLGVVVRDDIEEPYIIIIQLNGGKFVLGTECQYRPCDESTSRN